MSKFQTDVERHFSLAWNLTAKVLSFFQLRKYFSIKMYFFMFFSAKTHFGFRLNIRLLLGYYWVIIELLLGYLAKEKQRERQFSLYFYKKMKIFSQIFENKKKK